MKQQINDNVANLIAEARKETTSKERLQEFARISDELAEIVAQNVATSSELLSKLATHDNQAVRKAVTSNPNTPAETLLRLGKKFPKELLYNPVFELLILEDLSFLEKIPQQTLYGLLQKEDIADSLLTWASNQEDSKIREILKLHVKIEGESIEHHHQEAIKYIRETRKDSNYSGLIKNYDFYLLSHFLEYIPSVVMENKSFLLSVARNQNTPNEILEQLLIEEDYLVRESLTKNPNLSSQIIEQLSKDESTQVRIGITKRDDLPNSVLELLSKDKDESVKKSLLDNPNAPLCLLEEFFQNSIELIGIKVDENLNILSSKKNKLPDKYDFLPQKIARNPNASTAILEQLSSESISRQLFYEDYTYIDLGLAQNPNVPLPILERLAKQKDSSILLRVAENPRTSVEIIKFLIESFIEDRYENVLHGVPLNPNTPVEILEELALNKKHITRERVAQNRKISAKTLEKLSLDKIGSVREKVAYNPNTSSNVLIKLASDSKPSVRIAVARNRNTPVRILKQLAQDSHACRDVARNPNATLEMLEQLTNHESVFVRTDVLENPKCPQQLKENIFKNFAMSEQSSFSRVALFLSDYAESSVLAENSKSISWLERYAIAQNQKTPKDTLETLAQDGNRIVRATAKESLEKLSKED